mmetsp:Transcript_14375/g.21549  ORF Transcript_14375/g.21549 Transcript_14375/m.21549 type:complete len:86 (-) Transcript_14375:1293-1550(-)
MATVGDEVGHIETLGIGVGDIVGDRVTRVGCRVGVWVLTASVYIDSYELIIFTLTNRLATSYEWPPKDELPQVTTVPSNFKAAKA